MAHFEPVTAIGLMSGTSMDGVDAAFLVTDGVLAVKAGDVLTLPYDVQMRARLVAVMGGRGPVNEVEREITLVHSTAVAALLAQTGRVTAEIEVVGFHGHTLLHDPARAKTWQIGDGRLLAHETGISVVDSFRSTDVAAGGEGAPLTPVYHVALAQALEKPLVILNLGGVANVTWIGAQEGEVMAFDTGPGNALVDDWAMRHIQATYDRDGALASRGYVDAAALASLMDHPFFQLPPPKSLDRDEFDVTPVANLSAQDGAATLTAFTAMTVARARDFFPVQPRRWLVSGGGRHNPILMHMLEDQLGGAIDPVEVVGWNGDALEAQAFAYLAVRSLRGLPLSYPATTGVATQQTGGRYHAAPV